MEKNDKQVALVTGASSGIGETTALALAARGICVAVAAVLPTGSVDKYSWLGVIHFL